ncbi:LamG-like jellyroll fold domain-containing protein [Acidovorax sp. Root568]|uniref:LamG-like jellyroll fold domain-containing protein n=1 Tax=Acidovorax sp. Root568 TaxID=1736565 RepID=UPI00138EE8CB|nr:LamG-like jellyroll fold domain-containing protein [Acidovorax sp. Root568]
MTEPENVFMVLPSTVRFFATLLVLLACLYTEARAQPAGPDNALAFDGVDDYVSMSVPAPFQNPASSDFTILTWVRLGGTSSFQRILFAQQNSSNYVSIARNTGETIYAYVVANGLTRSVATVNPIGASGSWVHVAVVWKSTDQSLSVFVNGVQAPGVSGGSSSTGIDGQMALGSRSGGAQYFAGSLDRMAIYSSALSETQILRAGTQCIYPPSASHSYSFDAGAANGNNVGVTTLTDGVGSAPGTLNNFALTGTVSNWVDSNVSSLCLPPTYIVGGSVSGLAGTGLKLQLNGANDLLITGNGAFQFPAMADGASYSVTVASQPTTPAQFCSVINGSGTLSGGDVSSLQVTCATAAPSAPPTNAVATPGNAQATVSWSAPSDDGGAPITAYLVTGLPGGTCSVSGAPPATTCNVPNLNNGTAYTFSVVATNAVGNSQPSVQSNSVTPRADLVFVGGTSGTIPLAQATVGQVYNVPIGISGGLPPFAFSVSGGLPDGLSLNSTTGVISGTPTTAGTSIFSVTVTDNSATQTLASQTKATITQSFSIAVAAPVATSVPTLGQWALMLVACCIATLGMGQSENDRMAEQ